MAVANKEQKGLQRHSFRRDTLYVAGGFLVFGILTLLLGEGRSGELLVLGVLQCLLAPVLVLLGFVLAGRRKREEIRRLESFAFCTEATTRAAVLAFPSPMVITGIGGSIQWYNRSFQEMLGQDQLFGAYLQDFFPDLQFGRFAKEENPKPSAYQHKDKEYLIFGRVVPLLFKEREIEMVAIYFTDLTEQKKMERKLEAKKTVVCSAVIDNYDEVFKSTPNTEHGALIGAIERCVNAWVGSGEGISFRYERDRFLILFEAEKFRPLYEDRFRILDEVKEIAIGNRIPVTLSLGVGQYKDTIRENEELSRTALDMALGRGGDQVVVKTESGFQCFGGKSREIEKSTRVKARVVAHTLRELAGQASTVFVMGHRNADADSLGASAGLFRMMAEQNAEAYILLDRTQNNCQTILSNLLSEEIYQECVLSEERALDLVDENSLLIVVDTHRPGMVEFPSVLRSIRNLVLIDHHRRSEEFIEDTLLSYHEPYASSSCEMVTEILQHVDSAQKLKPCEAEALYSGIYLDTKGFTFKTGTRTFDAASYLRKLGVDPMNMRRLFGNDMELYLQKSRIISGAKIYRSNIAIALCTEKCQDIRLVVAQAADDLLNIRGIEAAFVLAVDGNHILISGRSLGTVNVQVILEKLGGGGHITIAGAQLPTNKLDVAEAELQVAIDEVVFS